ncbi:site-specific integrase [Croceibacter atlanticus]|uniref:Tyrosine type site-specific recombinase n=1 Tax=Croceibacter atlanticus (strain ATCC BAA-628 / JCM 21780 / CIP 108009 / IAM 15332 / KCTC 12090 / HTCC2559) TaxID=216432 RepID=A3U4L1_CROAH|nr:site-specific integrase [Croceibacter atlanticus]EAP87178.1 tyrosine type site-specific recombinase [Croceibacter atlanticus HTCC2559]
MASVKIILRKDKIDKTGDAPLYLRVIKDRRTKFISLSLKLHPNEWDDDKQKVKKNHQNSTRLNAYISKKVADAEGEIADLERRNQSTSARRIKEAIKGKPLINFFDFAFDRCEKLKDTVTLSTYRSYKNNIEKFERFVGHRELMFDDITATTLKNYASYCSSKLGNNNTTINYAFRILNLMFREAKREDLISNELAPFTKFKVKKNKTTKRYLNAEQFDAFMNLEVPDKHKAQVIKDMFIFSVFSGGLRFGDVIELQWKNYDKKNHRITKTIRKTKRQHSIRIGQKAIDILEKYASYDNSQNDIIFPFAKIDEQYFKDREHRSLITNRAISLSNMYLSRMGKQLELPFNLSFHISRHTFATRALNNGMRIEHVSKLMDHTDIGITQVYAKIISSELDNAVDKYIN